MKRAQAVGVFLAFLAWFLLVPAAPVSGVGPTALEQAAGRVGEMARNEVDAARKKCLENASGELAAAITAETENRPKDAVAHKRKALKWVVYAVRECLDPGEVAGELGERLREEGGISVQGLASFNELIADLLAAKKARQGSGLPFYHDLAIQQLTLALFDLVDHGGWDGRRPEKAIGWYLEAAAMCEDVQDMIRRLLEYMAKHSDLTGIPDISAGALQQARDMLDELYRMKAAGAPFQEISDLAEKIKQFLREEGARTARARREKDARALAELEEAEKRAREEAKRVQGPPQAAAVVHFTAVEGTTNVNRDFIGEVESITFLAVDGGEVDVREVSPGFTVHEGRLSLEIGRAARLAGIVVTGTLGVLTLVPDGRGGAPPGLTGLAPREPVVVSRNGVVRETFNVEAGRVDMAASPQAHAVSINREPATVLAARADQVAIAARGVSVPAAGALEVKFVSPDGTVLSGRCPAWGYQVAVPEITRTRAWVPVTAVVQGLEPGRSVSFRFVPQPGQVIRPLETVKPVEALAVPAPVAEIMVDKPGPQAMHVIVEPVPEP